MKAAWLVVLVALAGCSDDPSSTQDAAPADAPVAGILDGVVLDTTITPIAQANVTLDGLELTAPTNADGRFRIEGLAPGSYIVRADHPSFVTASTTVIIEAGGVTQAKVSMQPRVVSDPFVQPYQFDGFLQCSYRLLISGDNCPEGDAETTYTLERIPDWVQSELQWESGTSLGDELSFQYTVPGTTADYIETEGPSPLLLQADAPAIRDHGLGDGMDLYLRVFTADHQATRPPAGDLWGVGLLLDQDFTVFTHVFYDTQPLDGWSFIDDGPP